MQITRKSVIARDSIFRFFSRDRAFAKSITVAIDIEAANFGHV